MCQSIFVVMIALLLAQCYTASCYVSCSVGSLSEEMRFWLFAADIDCH